jgi:phage terminase large subunit GpA-like protein
MSTAIDLIGREWLIAQVDEIPEEIKHYDPVAFNEEHRYLPSSVSSLPGYIRFDVNPFMVEILECFDPDNPIREVNLKKGVQITYTTLLESILFYYALHVKTVPCMYVTADRELAAARVENNILPMFQGSGFGDRIRSSDIGNKRKTGATKSHIQWDGGGYLVPFGAKSPAKARQYSILLMLCDEVSGWPMNLGKDGYSVQLFTDRTSGYWSQRKIFRGSTPLIKGSDPIDSEFLRGDQRVFKVLCRHCNFPQVLRWEGEDKESGRKWGFKWDLQEGQLIHDSVRYACRQCGHEHYEYDKELLFALDQGAHWEPTAVPKEPDIRSYHLPALYSPIGMQPWSKSVGMFLEAWDVETRKVRDLNKLQVFYNNVLGESFEIIGSKVHFKMVSGHRRTEYVLGQVPNQFAVEFCPSQVLLLVCTVDVHKHFLAVAVWGITRDLCTFVVDYFKLEDHSAEGCVEESSPVWGELREVIEEREFIADNGNIYRVACTFVDAGYANDLVVNFCADYESGVYPTLGRDRPAKTQKIMEFAPFTTQAGFQGYRITVDHYKDRLAPVLRRDWHPLNGDQKQYHFNAPVNISDEALTELTRETRREEVDKYGNRSFKWYRPNAANELWDLLVMAHACVEILAWHVCVHEYERESIVWSEFWEYCESGIFYT